MTSKLLVRISISFPRDLYEELKKIADESERSLSKQVVFVLRNMVDRRKKLKEECQYPDWEGGLTVVGRHTYDKDGFCSICGEVE